MGKTVVSNVLLGTFLTQPQALRGDLEPDVKNLVRVSRTL